MNLGRGTQVDGAYQPVSAESMSKDMVLPPVGQNFRDRALACLRRVSSEVESLGSRLSVIAVGDSVAMNHQNIASQKVNKGDRCGITIFRIVASEWLSVRSLNRI